MKHLDHSEIEELLGAFALDAGDPDEAEVVELHLRECPRCRGEVTAHREVATLLGNIGGDAPAGVWDRLADQLDEAPPPLRLAVPGAAVIPLASRRRTANRIGALVIGAAAAVAIGVLGIQVVHQQHELDRVGVAVEDGSMLAAANVALRDPAATAIHLRSTDGLINATAVLLPDGTGYLMAQELPGLAGGRTYQLWGKTSTGLVSLGLLGGEPGAIVPFSASGPVGALAITAEVTGGVVQSANPAVVAGAPS